MPRIDPLQLLKCLSVLLGPTGGIKSNDEVQRLASLMTKFSKKLVSKCIYIQILKTTNTDLLGQFMGAGGWNLVHMWLTDGILAKNWALIQELLELLLLCPVDVERLKTNNCPKLIKGLSKEGSHHVVRVLASRLVEQWLKIVKGEAAPNSVPADIMTLPIQALIGQNQSVSTHQYARSSNANEHIVENGEIHDGQLQSIEISENQSNVAQLQDKLQQLQRPQQGDPQTMTKNPQQQKQYYLVSSSSQQQQQQSLPVYKITIRDGKQVLAKVETDAANINNVLNINNSNNEKRTNGDDNEDLSARDGEISNIEDNIQGSLIDGQELVLDNSNYLSSEVNESVASSKDINNQLNSDDVRDNNKDSKEGVSDSNKSSDKENRDFHKKEDKKSAGSSDKKLSSHSSSSRSSSKHGSSSHRSSSSSHRSSSHRSSSGGSKGSSSKEKSSSRDSSSSKDKDKHRSGSSSKHSSSSSSSKGVKSDREKDREREKEKLKKDQAEKDKATLEKIQGQALSTKMGKIPKKRAEDELRRSTEASPPRKLSTESKEGGKEHREKTDVKKASIPEKKPISMSIESRKNLPESSRPKTVKTFNSKFRSTGLEEEVKPPPPRFAKKAGAPLEKKLIPPKIPVLKRPSPPREIIPLPDKRARLSLDSPTTPPPTEDKKGGIKLIPAKPKPMVLQESDMFMDALTASTKSKEPRKRKRRTSLSKDGAPDPKKQELQGEGRDTTPPPSSPLSSDEKSPVVVKPNFKFYQDTLETDEDKEKKVKDEIKEELRKEKDEGESSDEKEIKDLKESKENNDEEERSTTPTPDDEIEDTKGPSSPIETTPETSDSDRKEKRDSSPGGEIRYVNGLKSVLLSQKRKGPKKTLKWKTDLESIRYFELDETERVNVTKTFTDAKQMEKQNEREAFQMARKLSTEDLMEEKTIWKPLIPVDLPPALVEYGKNSQEKDIQYAREKGILQALYFNRSMIPDSAAEPDEERHPMTDPKVIPLEDLTGNKESEKDFTSMAWPEPKPQIFQAPAVPAYSFPPFPHAQQPMMGPMGPQGPIPPMGQMPQQMMGPGPGPMGPMGQMGPMGPDMGGPMPSGGGGGGWRTGDGKVVVPDVGMPNMQGGYPPGPDGPLGPPGMMGPPMFNQPDGFGMMGPPDDMGYGPGNMGNNFQGPPGSGMYGPGPGPGPNFQGGPRGGPMRGGPGGMGRGGPGPGWYRGGGGPISGRGGGGWRGGGGGGGGWRGNGKQPPICRQFSKNGYCRVGDKCQYLHPGVNCPPF